MIREFLEVCAIATLLLLSIFVLNDRQIHIQMEDLDYGLYGTKSIGFNRKLLMQVARRAGFAAERAAVKSLPQTLAARTALTPQTQFNSQPIIPANQHHVMPQINSGQSFQTSSLAPQQKFGHSTQNQRLQYLDQIEINHQNHMEPVWRNIYTQIQKLKKMLKSFFTQLPTMQELIEFYIGNFKEIKTFRTLGGDKQYKLLKTWFKLSKWYKRGKAQSKLTKKEKDREMKEQYQIQIYGIKEPGMLHANVDRILNEMEQFETEIENFFANAIDETKKSQIERLDDPNKFIRSQIRTDLGFQTEKDCPDEDEEDDEECHEICRLRQFAKNKYFNQLFSYTYDQQIITKLDEILKADLIEESAPIGEISETKPNPNIGMAFEHPNFRFKGKANDFYKGLQVHPTFGHVQQNEQSTSQQVSNEEANDSLDLLD